MKVIIDCDTGNDDAWAIISLLKAEEKCDYKVIAITCVDGNTSIDHSALNNLLILKTFNRLEDVPVYKGSESGLLVNRTKNPTFHGVDGFWGVYSEKPSKDLVQKKHAVTAMKEYIDENPDDITLIAIGPLTNIALLIKLYPNTVKKLKSLYIMGGNHVGIGNTSKCSEFNFWCDPEAAHIVFAEIERPIYIFPWEPCIESGLSLPFDEWRINKLASNGNAFTTLLDPVEIKAYKNPHRLGLRRSPDCFWIPCDNFLACCFIYPKMISQMVEHHVTVELSGNHTRGQMIIDHLKENKPNAFVIKSIDVELFKKLMLWVCDHDVPDFDF